MKFPILNVSFAPCVSSHTLRAKGRGLLSKPSSLRARGLTLSIEDRYMTDLPAGIRRNNPGNLRRAIIVDDLNGSENGFATFGGMTIGLANMIVLLRNYYSKLGRRTLPVIIAHYAPASENDITQYQNLVVRFLNVNPLSVNTTDLRLEDQWRMLALCRAMIRVENGVPGPDWPAGSEWFTITQASVAFQLADQWKTGA